MLLGSCFKSVRELLAHDRPKGYLLVLGRKWKLSGTIQGHYGDPVNLGFGLCRHASVGLSRSKPTTQI